MSFVEYPETSDFPIENLPFGVFSTAANVSKLCCLAIHARANHTLYCFIFLMQLMVKEGEGGRGIEASHNYCYVFLPACEQLVYTSSTDHVSR